MNKLGRNEPCHCGSGQKYKKCCLEKDFLARVGGEGTRIERAAQKQVPVFTSGNTGAFLYTPEGEYAKLEQAVQEDDFPMNETWTYTEDDDSIEDWEEYYDDEEEYLADQKHHTIQHKVFNEETKSYDISYEEIKQ